MCDYVYEGGEDHHGDMELQANGGGMKLGAIVISLIVFLATPSLLMLSH